MSAKSIGEIIWEPTKEQIENSMINDYMMWLKDNKNLTFNNYDELYHWSTNQLEEFWASIAEYGEVIFHTPYKKVLQNENEIYNATWFKGATLNFVENIFAKAAGKEDKRAIYFRSEFIEKQEYTWKELKEKVGAMANSLRKMGVKKGDRIVSYMPNIPETVIAFLATASIGAIWSSTSQDFGAGSVIDRFKQIDPVVLFTVDGYQYNGKKHDRTNVITELKKEITSLKHIIYVPYINNESRIHLEENFVLWDDLLNESTNLQYEIVPFDHPLWVLYSSGTTGLPKSIVQGHGGIVLEQIKAEKLHSNFKDGDTILWYTTTGWVVWNLLISSMLTGSSIVLYDGSPGYPNLETLWKLAEDTNATFFGAGAPLLTSCMKANIHPKEKFNLSNLQSIGSTGAPLPAEAFNWIYEDVKEDIWLSSISGGTDICTAFVGGIPTKPVKVGMIQGKWLGVDAHAFDEEGNPLINEMGELFIKKPMPSMPLYFWNDPDKKRYIDSYFDVYPGVWRHGDWIKFDESGSCIIYGRSDSTINRSGVRIGSSDIYRAVEVIDEIADSLIIDLELMNQSNALYLFVVLKNTARLDDNLHTKIRENIKNIVSPKFIPDKIFTIDEVPKTINSKKLEVPIRKILLGFDPDKVINYDSMSNPESVKYFIDLASTLNHNVNNSIFN